MTFSLRLTKKKMVSLKLGKRVHINLVIHYRSCHHIRKYDIVFDTEQKKKWCHLKWNREYVLILLYIVVHVFSLINFRVEFYFLASIVVRS